MSIERRKTTGQISTEKNKLSGLASPTYDGSPGSQYELFEGVVERFQEGAFDAALKSNPDVVALLNHDSNVVLGRTPNTLSLRADARGLHYEISLPKTQAAKDLTISVERGDIKGSSFAFKPTYIQWLKEGNLDVRLIRSAELFDVSVVVNPAYGSSTAFMRSNEERTSILKERDEYRAKIETEKWQSKISGL